jgi:TolB protein
MAFSSSRSGKYEIWVMANDGSNPVRLTDHKKSNTLPAWSPDGKKIVFASSRSGRAALWMIHPDGTGLRKMSPEGGGPGAYYAAWSPDGTMLAFSSTKIANLTPWEQFLSRWSRRDPIIYDLANPEFGVPEHLRLLDLRNHELRQVTWGDSVNHRPVWSPDGRFLVFVHQEKKGEDYRLAILDVRSDTAQELDIESPEGMLPSWSPNGTRLAIQSTAPSGSTIWVLTLECVGKKRSNDLAQATDHSVR